MPKRTRTAGTRRGRPTVEDMMRAFVAMARPHDPRDPAEIAEAATEAIQSGSTFAFDPSVGEELYKGSGPEKPTRVMIDIDEPGARDANHRWNDTQRVQTRRDGSVRVKFTCDNFAPVIAWVLRLSPHATVIEPPTLIQCVRVQLRATIALYERSPAESKEGQRARPGRRRERRTLKNAERG